MMKKIFLFAFLIISFNVNSQFVVNYAQSVEQNELDGVYYNLPRNIIRLDFEVERIDFVKGKYSNYTEELLGTNEYVKDNITKYNIKNLDVTVLTEADEEMLFFISFDDKVKENLGFNMDFTSEGCVYSIGYNENIENANNTENIEYKYNFNDDEFDEFQYIPLRDNEDDNDTMPDMKPTEREVALSVMEEIKNIRIAYFDLITGYQEVNYGNTINTMLDELKKMEEEYLSLFIGKKIKHNVVETFYVVPEEGTDNYFLAKFSENDGFNSKSGDNIKIVLQENTTSNIKRLDKDSVKNTTFNNKMVYREPVSVNMKLIKGDDVIFTNRLQINQLGGYILLPLNKLKLKFDVNSGRLISVVK